MRIIDHPSRPADPPGSIVQYMYPGKIEGGSMAHKGEGRINDIAMQQLKRQRVDPNVTFIGRRTPAGRLGEEATSDPEPHLIVWIARHSVLPDKPQIRSVTLIDGDAPRDALLETFVDAVLPDPEKSLAPILPGRIEVPDQASLKLLRSALAPLAVEVAQASETHDLDQLVDRLRADLKTQLAPLPMWDVPIELKRDLASSAANVFRLAPWTVLGDVPLIAVELKRFGLQTLWLSLVGGEERQRGIFAFFTLDDFQRYSRATFAMAHLNEADGDPDNLDLPDEDIELVREVMESQESVMGDALALFYMDADAVGPALIKEMQEHHLPFANREAIPHFMRVGRDGVMRRPNEDEIRALRLALDAFRAFFTRYYQDIVNETWHFAPITGVVQPKEGGARIPVNVSISTLGPTFDPALRDQVLRLRVFLEDDLTVWREIEILAQQPLIDLDTAIREAFGWPEERESLFYPKDANDGDDTWRTLLEIDFATSDAAPVGLLLSHLRDFCHYSFDPDGETLDMLVRVRAISAKDPKATYPQFIVGRGELPDLQFDDEDLDDNDLDDDPDDLDG